MRNRHVLIGIGISALLVFWGVLIISIITVKQKNRELTQPPLLKDVEVEVDLEEETEEQISNFTTTQLNKEEVTRVLDDAVVVDMLLYYPINCDNWLLSYNDGYCEVFTLMVNDTEVPRVTVMKFANDVYVSHNIAEHKYLVYHNNEIKEISSQLVEASKEILLERNNEWLWNEYESAALFVLLDGDLENPSSSVGKGYFITEGKQIFLYDKIESDTETVSSNDSIPDYWREAEDFSYTSLLQEIVDRGLEVPTDMEKVFKQYIIIPKDYWYIEVINGELIVYSIIQKSSWHIEHPLFSYNYITEVFTIEE